MRTKLVIAILVVAIAISASVVLNAAQCGTSCGTTAPAGVGAGGPGPGACCPLGVAMGFGNAAKELGLTQDQIKQMKQHMDEFMTQTKATRDEFHAKCKEMCTLWAAEEPNVAAIKALAAEMDQLQADMRDAGIDHMVKGLSILTPAQREKLRTMVKNCVANRGDVGCGMWGSFGMGMGPGCGMGQGCGTGPGCGMNPAGGPGKGPGCGGCPLNR